jgi:hypothetical protein
LEMDADGKYSVHSAYAIQFQGSYSQFPATDIWQAMSEPKCKFFVWLAMHDRILIASNLEKRNWPCNHYCALCLCIHETTCHLLTHFNFTEATWNVVADSFGLPDYASMSAVGGPDHWVKKLIKGASRKERRRRLGILCTLWWMIWKERKSHIFDNKQSSHLQVAALAQGEIKLQLSTFGREDLATTGSAVVS